MILMLLASLVLGLLLGVILTIYLEWQIIGWYSHNLPPKEPATKVERPHLPKELEEAALLREGGREQGWLAVSLILQMVFQELKNSEKVRRWFLRKLSAEFQEILTRTTTGKLFTNVTIHELDLGTCIPNFFNVFVNDVDLHPTLGYIQELDIRMEMTYSGGFYLAVNADLMLGKRARLAIKVRKLCGKLRLLLSRTPYTHWSVSFIEDPELDIKVDSQFHLPQVTNIIVSQLKRAVRKRHTLPHFKLRFKPFFLRMEEEIEALEGREFRSGQLSGSLIECTRLNVTSGGQLYCLIAIDKINWTELAYNCPPVNWVKVNVEVKKLYGSLVLRQKFLPSKYQVCVVIDNAPSEWTEVRRGDVLLSVNGTTVQSSASAMKLLRSSSTSLVLCLERRSINKSLPEDDIMQDKIDTSKNKVDSENEQDVQEDTTTIRQRRGTTELTPQGSPRGSVGEENISASASDLMYYISNQVPASRDPLFDDVFTFNVRSYSKYLNISVWQTEESAEDRLVGHTALPLSSLIAAAVNTTSGKLVRTYQLKPPDSKASAARSHQYSSYSGFDSGLCYGDILLSLQFHEDEFSGEEEEDLLETEMDDTPESAIRKHKFVRSHFHTATFCGFCQKKIWLKDAFKCSLCGIACHKKCMVRCEVDTTCDVDADWLLSDDSNINVIISEEGTTPEIVTTPIEMEPRQKREEAKRIVREIFRRGKKESSSTPHSPQSPGKTSSPDRNLKTKLRLRLKGPRSSPEQPRRNIGSLLASMTQSSCGMKRVGSAQSLAPPSTSPSVSSRSLPPTPHHSPTPSRKTSLAENPFLGDLTGMSSNFSVVLDQLVEEQTRSVVETLLQYQNDEELISVAKECGRDIFPHLPLHERKDNINRMISHLQKSIDEETMKRQEMGASGEELEHSDHRSRALTLLMLYYCSGLQHVQSEEDNLALQAQKLANYLEESMADEENEKNQDV